MKSLNMKNKEYWKQLNDEYTTALSNNTFEEASEIEALDWFNKDRAQSKKLIDKYGESAWDIHRFMEVCRVEDISESFFRQLVRYEMDKRFKKTVTDKLNKYKSNLAEEKTEKIGKRLNTEKIKELEIRINTVENLI